MKKYIFSFILIMVVSLGYAQVDNKVTLPATKANNIPPITNMDDPPEEGGCVYCYQWNRDWDQDGFGDPSVVLFADTQPYGYVADQSDCNDSYAVINPNTVWYRDVDGDGYGNAGIRTQSCLQPGGYVSNSSDYNDTTANITNIAPQTFYRDGDGDTYGNPAVSVYYSVKPSEYVTNNLDCNDSDNSLTPNTVWYRDADGDNYGNGGVSTLSCVQPFGYVRNAADYNDGTANITNIPPQTFYQDADGDGYGNPSVSVYYSNKPTGYVSNNTDCNDNNVAINPSLVWYRDADADGYGNAGDPIASCIQPSGYISNAGDYNDTTVNITNIPPQTFYRDADNDGYGNPGASIYYSVMPSGYVTDNADCNDTDAAINPNTVWYQDADTDGFGNAGITSVRCTQPAGYVRNAADYNDGTANVTNITPQTFYQDMDGDGYGNPNVSVYYSVQPSGYVSNNSDYNDTTANITNIAPTNFYRDADQDTFGNPNVSVYYSAKPSGYVTNNGDYDDTTANITNIAPQTFYQDADQDTFGNPVISVYYSVKPSGYVTNNSDCNDADATLNPNTKWYIDNDLDDLGDPLNFIQQCSIPNGNYVRNDNDNCPLIVGTSSDCSNILTPSDYNYIITKTYKQPTASIIETPSVEQAQTNITYFDGLGRPMQQIANKQSSSGKDIVTPIEYDEFGRQLKEYLPYQASSANMAFVEGAEQNSVAFYTKDKYDNTPNPFSEKKLESSPLNRVLKQAAPGIPWAMGSGHEIKLDYQTNTPDEVKLYQATATWDSGSGLYEIAFSDQGNYAANELYKNVTYDENTGANPDESAGSTVEFKNKEGQVVLKRTYEGGSKHDTYYVYDIYGNLTYVIPPKADGAINDEVLNGLCYQYKYDYRNRLAEKKLPGKQWEFIVYDKLDRPVATGPALSPFKDDTSIGWLITKYDVFGRPVYTGWNSQTVSSAARKSLQDAQNNAVKLFESRQTSGTIDGVAVNYTNSIAPTNFKLLSVNYYDDYTYPNAPALPGNIEGDSVLSNVKGMATGSWTRVPTTAAAMLAETSTTFYDIKSRPVRTYTQNYLGGYTFTDSKLDFAGKTLYTISKHKRTTGDLELTIREEFTYSAQDRLLTHTHQINGGAVQLLAANTYDELGQLTSKNVGNSAGSPLQKVDFNYNIRGWLTEINKTSELQQNTDPVDLFAFKINYDKAQTEIPNVRGLYNGNIAETFWKTGSDNLERSYGYQYDKLNRLTNATYQKSKLTTDAYNENLSYDKNGNILSLNRNGDMDPQVGTNVIDNLTYSYPGNSNQLSKVVDNTINTSGFNDANITGDDYAYDDNGNLIVDKNKNITTIQYNQLNLPKKIIFGTGNTIEYIYNAAGQKLEKIVTENNVAVTTDYLGGFQYKENILEFFPTAEGYVKNESGVLSYVFQYKDHLGNIRLSFAKNPQTQVLEIIEENNYYPFGLKHKGYNDYVATNNKYKYNGKELQDELGLGIYDYGARNYDPALGRWINIDPLAEKSRRFNPYTYCLNNPIRFIDPDGMEADDIIFVVRGSNGAGDRTMTYKNGSATWNDTGKKYDGKGGNSTINRTLAVYKKIQNGNDKVLKNQLSILENSSQNHYIEAGVENDVDPSSSKPLTKSEEKQGLLDGKPTDTQTTLNFSEDLKQDFKETEGVVDTDSAIVTHEMQHQYDYDQGKMADSVGKSGASAPSEQRAVKNENRARKSENVPVRTTYNGVKIDPKKL